MYLNGYINSWTSFDLCSSLSTTLYSAYYYEDDIEGNSIVVSQIECEKQKDKEFHTIIIH